MGALRRAWYLQLALNLLTLLGVIALAVFVYLNSRDNTNALCDLRGNSERQVSLAQGILDTHQSQPVIFGIPRSVYNLSIKNQKRTVDALSNLNC